ncbi:MAG: hypothetical protein RBR71_13590 [Gudongella sp.]|nr:hypothetical protein [Gudongella sp.]
MGIINIFKKKEIKENEAKLAEERIKVKKMLEEMMEKLAAEQIKLVTMMEQNRSELR